MPLDWSSLRALTRPADLLDVALIALVIYAALHWLRTARARFVVRGLIVLAGLYVVARLLDLYLTLMLFQAGLAVAAVALIVMFQEDLRRAFERLVAGQGVRDAEPGDGPTNVHEVLRRTLPSLARRRIGALVVLRREEPLDRHLSGGVALDALPSDALLDSLFDPSSAGHDGAIVIEHGRVVRFGVHLPLSPHAEARMGTRHTAALGLAERSDALVLVVSEERGEVSVAEGGKIRRLDPDGLRALLAELSAARAERRAGCLAAIVADPGTKLASVVLAMAAWLVIVGHETRVTLRTFAVPVVYHDVPDGLLLDEPKPVEVRVTMQGPTRGFDQLDTSGLVATLDVHELGPGTHEITLSPLHVPHPRDLIVQSFQPAKVTVAGRAAIEIDVPIKPDLVGSAAPSRRLGAITVEPARVRLAVPQGERKRVTSVETAPIEVGELRGKTTLRRALVLPPGARLGRGAAAEVDVTLELDEVAP